MIANPSLPYYRYDPYSKVISAEGYAHDQLHHNRKKAISACSAAMVFRVIQVCFPLPPPSPPPSRPFRVSLYSPLLYSILVMLYHIVHAGTLLSVDPSFSKTWDQIVRSQYSLNFDFGARFIHTSDMGRFAPNRFQQQMIQGEEPNDSVPNGK